MENNDKQTRRFVFDRDKPEAQPAERADEQALEYKSCIFCAEPIRSDAFKCRFCGEFLNTPKAKALEKEKEAIERGEELPDAEKNILFSGRPSLFGLIGPAIRAAIIIAIGVFMTNYPVEDLVVSFLEKFSDFQITDSQYYAVGYWRQIIGVGLSIVVLLLFAYKVLKLKMTYYEVTPERIEYSRGIFDRHVDNLDMFRVVDLKLRRNISDVLLGIGQVTLITTDKSDPKFTFYKIRKCRRLYDVIKKASLEADQKQGVIHLE